MSFQKRLTRSLLSILLTTVVPLSSYSQESGGSNGGGGTGVPLTPNGQLVLLDLFSDQSLATDVRTYPLIKLETKQEVPICISQNFTAKDLPAYKAVMEKLSAWKAVGTLMIPELEHAINNIQFRFTNKVMSVADRERSTAPLNVELVALVRHDKELGAIANVDAVNRLGDLSFQGLLIHEGLRHLQQTYGIEFTDKFILDFTRALIAKSPAEINLNSMINSNKPKQPSERAQYVLSVLIELENRHQVICGPRESADPSFDDRKKELCDQDFDVRRMYDLKKISNYISVTERLEKESVGDDQIDVLNLLDSARTIRMNIHADNLGSIKSFHYADAKIGMMNGLAGVVRDNYSNIDKNTKSDFVAKCSSLTDYFKKNKK